MTTRCPHCYQDHEVYWYVDPRGRRQLSYTCNAYPRQVENKVDGRPELHKFTVRCALDSWELGTKAKKKLDKLPVLESPAYQKAQAEKHQCKLDL